MHDCDVWVCSETESCFAIRGAFPKIPVVGFFGMPILNRNENSTELSRQMLTQFIIEMASSPDVLFVANNMMLAEQFKVQTGVFLPVLRAHALYLRHFEPYSHPAPLVNQFLVWGRQYLDRSYFVTILEALQFDNPQFKNLEFEFVRDRGHFISYEKTSQYQGIVMFPWDYMLMFFYEHYTRNCPMFIPDHQYLFVVEKVASFPDQMDEHFEVFSLERDTTKPTDDWPSPFWDYAEASVEQFFVWYRLSDFGLYPHQQRFSSVAELLMLLRNADFGKISNDMSAFNARLLGVTIEGYRNLLPSIMANKQRSAGFSYEPY